MEIIENHIESGRRFLVIDLQNEQVQLLTKKEIMPRLNSGGLAIVDLQMIKKTFELQALNKDAFVVNEVAKMADVNPPVVNSWVREQILTPSQKQSDGKQGQTMIFDRTDAFIACLVASLKRKCGLQLKKLKNVSRTIRPIELVEESLRSKRSASPKKRKKAKTTK